MWTKQVHLKTRGGRHKNELIRKEKRMRNLITYDRRGHTIDQIEDG